MIDDAPVKNLYACLSHKPLFQTNGTLLLLCSTLYHPLASRIKHVFHEINPNLTVILMNFDEDDTQALIQNLHACNHCFLFYNNDYSQHQGYPLHLQPIIDTIKEYPKKIFLFKNFHTYFDEAFRVNPYTQDKINRDLIALASTAKHLIYQDDEGSYLKADIQRATWNNLSGIEGFDVVPGEISTRGVANGVIHFKGSFFGFLPFALAYGVIDYPLTLEIENNRVIKVQSENKRLASEFQSYVDYCESNARVEELGIGTNPYAKLYAVNAPFEERHVGLHLGFGGAEYSCERDHRLSPGVIT
jgi:hypothetical protein